jgi:hypothetical protein
VIFHHQQWGKLDGDVESKMAAGNPLEMKALIGKTSL